MSRVSPGAKFGRLTVVADRGYETDVECIGDCGTERRVTRYGLRSGMTRSCGCLRDELHAKRCADQKADYERRFWGYVEQGAASECWSWTGHTDSKGYGRYGAANERAHLVSYTLTNGPIPAGLELDHLCHDPHQCELRVECPHRRCCNPSHLVAVTHKQNVARGLATRSNVALLGEVQKQGTKMGALKRLILAELV